MAGRKRKQKAKQRRQERRKAAAANGPARPEVPPPPAAPAPVDLTKLDTFLADHRKERAAQLLAEKDLSVTDIAAALGVSRQAIYLWQREPGFAARVEEHARLLGEVSRQFLIARRTYRLGNLQERLLQMRRVIDARAAARSVPDEEGGDSGIVVRQERVIGSGDNAVRVEEFKVDLGLLKEMRETERQAAQECGQWTEKRELTGAGGGPLRLTLEEALAADRELEEWEAAQAGEETCTPRPPTTDAP